MQDMTTRIVPIEPQWFMQKAEVQSRTWRELNQGHIPQDIVDATTPAFALKLTRGHAADPNQWNNLAAKPESAPIKNRLGSLIPAKFAPTMGGRLG